MQDKGSLYRFVPDEVLPPQQVWNRIASTLDKNEMPGSETIPQFSAAPALAGMEVEPPASVWQNIQQELDRSIVVPISPYNKTRRIWVAAVAAACVAAVIFTSIYTTNNNATLTAASMPAIMRPVMVDSDSQGHVTGQLQDPKIISVLSKNPLLYPAESNGYVEAIGLNGNRVKISAKLSPIVEFLDDKVVSNSTGENSIWKQKLNNWKAMVNSPSANTALINFADPIDLIRFLQNKK